jgi:hypothetical protein
VLETVPETVLGQDAPSDEEEEMLLPVLQEQEEVQELLQVSVEEETHWASSCIREQGETQELVQELVQEPELGQVLVQEEVLQVKDSCFQ